jgi:HD-GYP domain-containing protein (c-di-GMP phosphodiesterase class II)
MERFLSADSTALDVRCRATGMGVSSQLLNAVTALAHALEAKDPYTRGHSARVSLYGLGIARAMGLNARTITAVVLGGELHDVGKIGVPGALLRKHGPLTTAEHREVMQHTVVGEHILRPLMSDRPTCSGWCVGTMSGRKARAFPTDCGGRKHLSRRA